LMRTPATAATYRRILAEAASAGGDRVAQIEKARDAYYRGFVAEAIGRFYAEAELMDSSGRRNGGLLAADDLARYQARIEPTVSRRYHGLDVHKTGPWAQGPVLLEALALLEGFDLDAMGPASERFAHTVVECLKLAYADREVFYGDPDVVEVPLATFLSDDYAAARRKLIGETASTTMRPGDLPGAAERMARVLAMAGAETPAGIGEGEPTFAPLPVEWGDTVHIDVVDRWGNMVSATPSGGWLQSSPVVPELGVCLGSRMQMLWLEEGLPASLEPGKRPRSTLSPSMAFTDGKPYLAFGTPGGDQQDQWSLLMFLHHVHHGMNLQEAIDCPAFHNEPMPNSF